MKYFLLAGRLLFSFIFISAGFNHFTAQSIAIGTMYGLPLSNILVPLSGVVCIVGGLSVLIGYKARIGAALLVVFLIPTTLIFHQFWTETDPMMKQMGMVMFMKNISMLGAAMMISYMGSGPLSLDNRKAATTEQA